MKVEGGGFSQFFLANQVQGLIGVPIWQPYITYN